MPQNVKRGKELVCPPPHDSAFSPGIFNLGAKLPRTRRGPNLKEEDLQILLALFDRLTAFGLGSSLA
jgi:hypothetical protein